MSGVDSRIATMKFDNASFERNAGTTLRTLDKLKQSLHFGDAATKGLSGFNSALAKTPIKNPFAPAQQGMTDLQQQTDRFHMTGLTGSITGVSKSFVAMSTIAITALSRITDHVISTGVQMTKSLTVDPIKGGLEEYETNLNSIQTILANTQASGATLEDVNSALKELNDYSDKTIYNFSQMARNIGTFTAAGVDLDTATGSIKGIANLAALSGSNAEQASTAMYQLSQAISSGRVGLQDWNSVVNAGMGGATFQRALAQTAVAMGEIDAKSVKLKGKMKNVTVEGTSFRESIMAKPGEQSWLTSKVLTKTLQQFTGDMSDAQLKAQGFSQAQIDAIQKTAKTAQDAATKVKTLSGVLDTAKEVVGSGWAQTWQIVFGDFKEARTLFTSVSESVNGFLGRMADARNALLGRWKDLGGRKLLIEGIGNAFEALGTVLKPIKRAFRDIFPAKTGRDLLEMTQHFVRFTKGLAISRETSKQLRRTFDGVFAIFSIIGKVIGAVAHQFGRLFGSMSDGSGSFLEFTGGIADSIVKFNKFLEKSKILETVFNNVGDILAVPLQLIQQLGALIGNLFGGVDTTAADAVAGSVNKFSDSIRPIQSIVQRAVDGLKKFGDFMQNIGSTIATAMGNIGDVVARAITPETFKGTLDVLNTALLGGIVLMLRNFFRKGIKIDAGGGLFDSVKETLGSATGALQAMQQSLKADTLMKIAGALAILTASLYVLSTIDSADLAKAFTALVAGFFGLQFAMTSLNASIGIIGAAKLPLITGSLMALAGALVIFALAVKLMQSMELGDMLRGLFGLGAMLFILQKSIGPLTKNSGGIVRVSGALILLGIALNLMAVALKIFATMSWEEMARGLAGVTGTLVAIAAAMRLMPKGIVLQAAALVILSGALNALAVALKIFATISWEEMGRGLTALAGALGIIAAAMRLMPKGMLLQAAALVAVSFALNGIGLAIKHMGGMTWKQIAKGLTTLAGAMLILAVGLNAMSGTLLGAAALSVAAGALALLAPVLIALGSVNWMTILKSLAFLAGLFTVLGVAGLVLAPVVPVIIGLAAAMLLLGAGLALTGAGFLAFATGFAIIKTAGAVGIAVLGDMIKAIIDSIPEFMKGIALGVAAFAEVVTKNGPKFAKAMGVIIGALLDAVIANVPKMGKAILTIVDTMLRVLTQAIPKIVTAGLKLMIGLLTGIRNNLPKIVSLTGDIIIEFINSIAKKLPGIIDSGFNLLLSFINGVSTAVDEHSYEMGAAGARLAVSLVAGVVNGIKGAVGQIKDALVGVLDDAKNAALDFIGAGSPSRLTRDVIGRPMVQGIAVGMEQETPRLITATEDLANEAVSTLSKTMSGISDAFKMEADMNPTIAPVLDLTNLTREANKMSSILATQPIMAGVSYSNASDISATTQEAQKMAFEVTAENPVKEVKFEQNNYSPKALSAVEIYRSTRNQLSLAKEALQA